METHEKKRTHLGMHFSYYDDLARTMGCYPSLWKLLMERPTAIWHAWLTTPQVSPI